MREKVVICAEGLGGMAVQSDEVYCLHCGGEIPPARLKAMPKAKLCVDCQEAAEKRKG